MGVENPLHVHMERMEKKEEDDGDTPIPFIGVEKGAVVQERHVFNETPLNVRKCCFLMTKVLYLLLNKGSEFTSQEATDLFFAATKLFQSTDPAVRRLNYMVLKELIPYAKDVIIVCASLIKDMNSNKLLYKANAIRTLCRAVDELSLLGQQGERLLKQAVVDQDSYVASSALVSAYRLASLNAPNQEIIKRWTQEITEASKNQDDSLVSYHALGLLYKIRKHDRLAVTRLATAKASQQSKGYSSPFEACLFIRIITNLIREVGVDNSTSLINFLHGCKSGHSMVKFEAAKALCSLEDILTPSSVSMGTSTLVSMLSGTKNTAKVSALRVLNQLKSPSLAGSQQDLEALVADTNLSVASLAIGLLLKTGVESNVENHLRTLSNFMVDVSDEFKCTVVDSIKSLCLKFPRKKTVLLTFLAKSLRDEGKYHYKSRVVDTLMDIMKLLPETKEEILLHLSDFIEDCEYSDLSSRILYTLGEEGTSTSCSHKFIRYIFNRILLESPVVRVAAVNALAKYGRRCPALHKRVCLLLTRCFGDNHEIVREQALVQYRILQQSELNEYVSGDFDVPAENLVTELNKYLQSGQTGAPFDLATVPRKVKQQPQKKDAKEKPLAAAAPKPSNYAEQLSKVPELASLGKLLCSSKPVPLTESETEYTVTCIKHTYPDHLVMQFDCINTLNDQLLEEVSVKVEIDDGFEVVEEVPLESLPYDTVGSTFVILQRDAGIPTATCACTLKFTAKEVDKSTGEPEEDGFEDEYQLEEIDIGIGDYMGVWVPVNPSGLWDTLGEDNQQVETYSLSSFKSLQQACSEVSQFLHMLPCGNSNWIPGKSSKMKHILFLSGKFLGETEVIARARMRMNPSGGVDMELTIRSLNPDLNEVLCNAL